MIERAVKPLPDGYVLIYQHNKSFPERLRFTQFKSYTMELFGFVIITERSRRVIPWNMIREIEEHFNSDEYQKLLEEWIELDHPYHTIQYPETDCSMCLETAMSNLRMKTVWTPPSE